MSVDSKTIEQQERTIRREFAADLAGWMLENWIDAPKDYHAAWWPLKKMWFCKKEPLTKDDLVRMFTSESSSTPLGAYFIDPGGNTKRVTLDIDAHKDGESAEPVVRKACAFLTAHKIPFVVARSKGGKGYHVTVYFDHPISSIAARNLGLAIVKVAELPEKTEVFPKQFELRKGEYGSQVALPGSYFFWKKSGGTGSTLVDPETLEAIPFGEWLDYLRSVPPLSEKTLREMAQRGSVDLWAKPKRTTPRFNPDDFVCDGVPTFTAVEQVVGFLSQHGIEVQKEKGAFGDWTDRLLLLSCVNSEAHGSTRSDGAAVLFNAANGRVGYKCWHEGCNLFSWPKLLRKLGYRFRKKTPAEKPAEPPHDHEECEPHDHEECEPEDAPKDHQLSEEERVNMRMGGRNADVSRSGFAVRITEECAMCGETFSKFVCKEHGIFMTRPDRCNKPICPNCVRVKWKVDHEPYIREKWPEKAFFVELPVNTPEEMRGALKRTSHLYRKNRDQQGRWFKGWMSVLYVFDTEDAPYCKSFGLEGKVMAKDEYIPIVRHYWLAQSDGVVEEYRETGDFVSVVERHEDVLKSMKRTSAGKKATKTFPWLSTDAAREQARAAWQAAHPGLKPNECCKVVGKKPDGSPVYCAKKGLQIVEHTRTHEVIAKSTKALRADDIAQAKRAADNRYLEQFRARMFTADAA